MKGIKVISTSKQFIYEIVLPLLKQMTGKQPSLYTGETGFSKKKSISHTLMMEAPREFFPESMRFLLDVKRRISLPRLI